MADIAFYKCAVQDLKATARWNEKAGVDWGHNRLPGNMVLFDLYRQSNNSMSGHLEFLRDAPEVSAGFLKQLPRYAGVKSTFPAQHEANAAMIV